MENILLSNGKTFCIFIKNISKNYDTIWLVGFCPILPETRFILWIFYF
jgi:hypothetical protein